MLSALQAAAGRAEAAPSLGQGLAHLRPLLADVGWLDAMIADQCTAMARDPLHLPPMRASGAGPVRHLILIRTERVDSHHHRRSCRLSHRPDGSS